MFKNLSGAYSRPTNAFPEADLSRSSSPCLMPRRKSLESGATTELAMSGTDGSTHPPSSGESGANVEIGGPSLRLHQRGTEGSNPLPSGGESGELPYREGREAGSHSPA